MKTRFKIALAGNPNCGKTSIFNALTGARQHVGNYPGVMNEAAGALAFEDFLDGETAFLERLARPVWGKDAAAMANANWAWFCTWSGDFVQRGGAYSDVYTEKEMLKRVYDSERVLTLDELPAVRESLQ